MRHFPQFHKIQYILKMSLKETPFTISQVLIYTTSVSWIWFYIERNTFYNSKKFGFILKVSLKETFATISKIPIYTKGFLNFNFHLQQFQKFLIYITIVSQIWFYIGVLWKNTFSIYWIFWNCRRCLFKRHL